MSEEEEEEAYVGDVSPNVTSCAESDVLGFMKDMEWSGVQWKDY